MRPPIKPIKNVSDNFFREQLFGIYLMFSGTERFFIEKIRVNTIMDFMGLTQAEIISSSLFILGCVLVVYGLVKKIPVSNIGTTVE